MRTKHVLAAAGLIVACAGLSGTALAGDHHDDPHRHDSHDHRVDEHHPPRSALPYHCNAYKLRHHIACHD